MTQKQARAADKTNEPGERARQEFAASGRIARNSSAPTPAKPGKRLKYLAAAIGVRSASIAA
jgi:hypothetical protein